MRKKIEKAKDRAVFVPGEILSAFVAKLRLYEFWPAEVRFTELLGILEKADVKTYGAAPAETGAARIVDRGAGEGSNIGLSSYFWSDYRSEDRQFGWLA